MRVPVMPLETVSGEMEELELEAHHVLLNDKWRQLFDKFDPEGFGEIPWADFLVALESPDFQELVEPAKREALSAKARHRSTSAITFEDFVAIMSGKRARSFRLAVRERRDREELLREGEGALFRTMVAQVAHHFLADDRDRRYYADRYACCPPPLFILLVTLSELLIFAYYAVYAGGVTPTGPVPIDSPFIYRPDKRVEVWRFFLYMFLHAGWVHLIFNLLVQVLVGLPLEMVHGSLRIGTVYMAGVLAGSLGTSVFDSDVYLVGASGGVYALLAAHLANVLLNYNQMEFGKMRLAIIFVIASCDVGIAVYNRYASEGLDTGAPVSYAAHLAGALAGLTIGLLVLKNFEQKLHEQLLWWVALGVYAACTLFALLFNIFNG